MIKQNVFIINFNSLYEILEEIKDKLPFKIIKYEGLEDFNTADYLDIKKSLIIVESEKKLILKKDLKDNNFFNLKNIPISLNKLVELINIQLIKLKFSDQSKIMVKNYELDFNSKFFSKDNIVLKLTEKEVQIILYLSQNKEKHHVLDLQKNIWSYSSSMETHTVETHIYRLRKKISEKFNDENFILSHKTGYFID
jgi:hypothetical protein|tara:strand:- start:1143 stop:1730 length:588 start_codon:yes stop_codon:yes gene_type:complete